MVKRSNITTQQPKLIENPGTNYLKSIKIKHPKMSSHKLSKTIKQTKKVSRIVGYGNFTSLFYNETTKHEIFFDEKNAKIMKRTHAYKCYASSYNVNILNPFNLEIQFKNTESAIINRLKHLLTELRGFNFAKTLVIGF